MDIPLESPERRKMLQAALGAAGGIAAAGIAVPFVESMEPSEAARAAGAPVEVDIGGLEPGKLITVEWRGKPVWILHRTDAMLASLKDHDALLADPSSRQSEQPRQAANPARSLKPPFLVLIGICTHLGCVPTFRPEPGSPDLGAAWPGGFYCPCHGSRFDLAGRVFKNVPAPANLVVPDYRYIGESRLLIGTSA
ncbi:ubiquinol-cytochrome c reductase iron-sulfur subunit [Noviherbaspirillum galbum]|uniref:Ubiquinol-cytochrome c reductase iron-sulfur subunit n=1 Tax=Noviherbaspirillum galbum TaxID=2709383 RepID=A0A6B3SZC9_9BURK|nr:ubiquinol-cytochrome c reductase iron-sulfur subunit [Noviherbaspirillum galbum]NEX64592.1 ubiquinol-cytochrome c reductase iron-sulfur subunit [Noviherbaspirillum galbum]